MNLGTVFETMQSFIESGTVRAIGVCNFNLTMLRSAVDDIRSPIACHQIEYHPFLDQSKMLSWLREKDIPLVAYAPLAQGRAASDTVLQGIGLKHGVSASQVGLAWLLEQEGVAVIPKASRRENQQPNLDPLTVKLDDDDRRAIARLPKDQRFVTPPFAPDWDA